MYLLDTNAISHMMREPLGIVARRVKSIVEASVSAAEAVTPLCTSVIVQCELLYGIRKRQSQRLLTAYQVTMQYIPVLPLDETVSEHYSFLRTALESNGTAIGPNDCFIAAHALALNAIVVTHNEAEFRRVPNLKVENWLQTF